MDSSTTRLPVTQRDTVLQPPALPQVLFTTKAARFMRARYRRNERQAIKAILAQEAGSGALVVDLDEEGVQQRMLCVFGNRYYYFYLPADCILIVYKVQPDTERPLRALLTSQAWAEVRRELVRAAVDAAKDWLSLAVFKGGITDDPGAGFSTDSSAGRNDFWYVGDSLITHHAFGRGNIESAGRSVANGPNADFFFASSHVGRNGNIFRGDEGVLPAHLVVGAKCLDLEIVFHALDSSAKKSRSSHVPPGQTVHSWWTDCGANATSVDMTPNSVNEDEVSEQRPTSHASRLQRTRIRKEAKSLSVSVDVRAIRVALGMTQDHFAESFGFSVSSVRQWEQGARTPEAPVALLLRVIEKFPDQVKAEVALLRTEKQLHKQKSTEIER